MNRIQWPCDAVKRFDNTVRAKLYRHGRGHPISMRLMVVWSIMVLPRLVVAPVEGASILLLFLWFFFQLPDRLRPQYKYAKRDFVQWSERWALAEQASGELAKAQDAVAARTLFASLPFAPRVLLTSDRFSKKR